MKPAFQIGILNFTLFPKYPEFFSTYKMLNIKKYQKYSDKFTIHVLDLTQVGLAGEEDKAHDLDKWARLFNALTWEDFKMISADNKNMQEAGETLFTLNANDQIRDLCEAREDYRRTWDSVKLDMEEKDIAIRKMDTAIKEKDAAIKEKDTAIREKDTTIREKDTTIREKDTTIREKDTTIREKDSRITSLEAQVAELQRQLQNRMN